VALLQGGQLLHGQRVDGAEEPELALEVAGAAGGAGAGGDGRALGGHGHVGLAVQLPAQGLDRRLQPQPRLGPVELGPPDPRPDLVEAPLALDAQPAQVLQAGGHGPHRGGALVPAGPEGEQVGVDAGQAALHGLAQPPGVQQVGARAGGPGVRRRPAGHGLLELCFDPGHPPDEVGPPLSGGLDLGCHLGPPGGDGLALLGHLVALGLEVAGSRAGSGVPLGRLHQLGQALLQGGGPLVVLGQLARPGRQMVGGRPCLGRGRPVLGVEASDGGPLVGQAPAGLGQLVPVAGQGCGRHRRRSPAFLLGRR
jgi:hypothetical protein